MPKRTVSFCSIDSKHGKSGPLASRLMRLGKDYSWSGIKTERYKAPRLCTWDSVIRRVLVGSGGERTKFHVRYFEIAPGGYTTFERHRHEHVVIGVRGSGRCRTGKKTYDVGFMDTLYICPGEPHQLSNPHKEPFGFFCIVDAKRDKPREICPKKPGRGLCPRPKRKGVSQSPH